MPSPASLPPANQLAREGLRQGFLIAEPGLFKRFHRAPQPTRSWHPRLCDQPSVKLCQLSVTR